MNLDKATKLQRLPKDPPDGKDRLTFHSDEPRSVIDWILISSDWQFVQYKVIASRLSDHRPLVADIRETPAND